MAIVRPPFPAGSTHKVGDAVDEATVFVVDDEDELREAICRLLEVNGLNARGFPSAEAFLAECEGNAIGCLLIDICLPGMDGLQLQRRLVNRGIDLGIVLLTGHGTVQSAVTALQWGAIDYLEKPFQQDRLLSSIRAAIQYNLDARAKKAYRQTAMNRLKSLTPRERQILDRLVAGQSTKQIAYGFGTTDDTVRKQRSSILRKMQVANIAELVRMMLLARASTHSVADSTAIEAKSA